ncbi:MAG: hypothetical protein LBT75_05735 [Bacilli bacterium]|jgi:hypothetical protein|nr:hypothetical protein [Bacilli bacterium]
MKKYYFIIFILCLNLNVNIKALDNCLDKDLSNVSTLVCSNQEIDYNKLKDAQHLKKLVITSNNLEEIPSTINLLSNLEYLDISSNNIGKITNLDKLTKLKTLIIDNNSLTNINNISKIKSLETLSINSNSLFYLANDINNLINLKTLSLDNNSINAITKIDALKLQSLSLKGNLLIALPDLSEIPLINLKLDNNLLTKKEVITKHKIFPIINQSEILVLNRNYEVDTIWYNKNNTMINNTKLSNNKKALGFKEYNIVNVKSNNKKVFLNEYFDLNTNKVLKTGTLQADIELVSQYNDTYIIPNAINLKLIKNISDNNINILTNINTIKKITDISNHFTLNVIYLAQVNLNDLKNNNQEQVVNKDKVAKIITIPNGVVKDYDDSFIMKNYVLLSVLFFLFFILPLIIGIYMLNKIKKTLENLKQYM